MYILLAIVGLCTLSIIIFFNLPRFGRLPSGERLKRVEQSPNYREGAFHNQSITPQLTTQKSKVRSLFDFVFEKRERNRPEKAIPAIKSDLKSLPKEKNLIVWFGHSSYLLQIDGKRILVDPVFYDASPLSFFNKPFPGTDIYRAEDMPDIDYLIITHDHWDHLDHRTVTKLRDRIGKVIAPLGVGEHFEHWGYKPEQLIDLDWNQKSNPDSGFTIHCLPARHFSGRTFKANQTLWASYMVVTPSQTIYLSGDGGYDSHFAKIANQFPHIDLAIMENGQYNKDWRYIHLLPEDLLKAVDDLKPKHLLAGHNSKYALAKHPWDEPLEHAFSINSIIMPTIGEILDLRKPESTNNRWWDSAK